MLFCREHRIIDADQMEAQHRKVSVMMKMELMALQKRRTKRLVRGAFGLFYNCSLKTANKHVVLPNVVCLFFWVNR